MATRQTKTESSTINPEALLQALATQALPAIQKWAELQNQLLEQRLENEKGKAALLSALLDPERKDEFKGKPIMIQL